MATVREQNLVNYLNGIEVYHQANMVRKGRETSAEVSVEKGEIGFLSDRIVLVDTDSPPKAKETKIVARDSLH
jgi:hypothetical protein